MSVTTPKPSGVEELESAMSRLSVKKKPKPSAVRTMRRLSLLAQSLNLVPGQYYRIRDPTAQNLLIFFGRFHMMKLKRQTDVISSQKEPSAIFTDITLAQKGFPVHKSATPQIQRDFSIDDHIFDRREKSQIPIEGDDSNASLLAEEAPL